MDITTITESVTSWSMRNYWPENFNQDIFKATTSCLKDVRFIAGHYIPIQTLKISSITQPLFQKNVNRVRLS